MEAEISSSDFALDVCPMPGVANRIICRWQHRVIAPFGDFWDTVLITAIEPRFENDMRADLAAFAKLGEKEREEYLKERIRNTKPYSGRCLPDVPSLATTPDTSQMALF